MRFTVVFLLASILVAAPVASAQTTDPVTQEDLDALEQRLLVAIQDGHSGTAAVVRNEVDALDASVAAANDQLATILSIVQSLSQEQAALADHAAALEARVAGLEASNQEIQASLAVLENDTLEDHRNLWQTFTNDDGESHLDQLAELVENNTAAIDESRDYMDALSQSQFRLRGDLDNMTGLLTTGFNHVTTGQEAVFKATDRQAGAGTTTNVLLILLVILNAALFSYAFKIPRRLWRRLDYERQRVEARGEYVEPPCPLEDQGQALGDFFACPEQDSCPVRDDCRVKALQATEKRVLAQPDPVLALGGGADQSAPEPARPAASVPVDLSRFGRME